MDAKAYFKIVLTTAKKRAGCRGNLVDHVQSYLSQRSVEQYHAHDVEKMSAKEARVNASNLVDSILPRGSQTVEKYVCMIRQR